MASNKNLPARDKKCTKCGEVFRVPENRRQSRCNPCRQKQAREYYAEYIKDLRSKEFNNPSYPEGTE